MAPSSGGGLSVVIPCHGRADLLPDVLAPLLATEATAEVVVVADDDPRIRPVAESVGDPRVCIIEHEGCHDALSRQIGVEAANSEVVLLLDDDVVLRDGVVDRHLKYHRRYLGSVLLGSMPVDPHHLAVGGFPIRLYSQTYEQHTRIWAADPEAILDHFWAGHFSLRRDNALAAGLDDPHYRGLYFTDYQFGLRMKAIGLRGVFDSSLSATHFAQKSIEGWTREARRQGAAISDKGHPRGLTTYCLSRIPGSRTVLRGALRGVGLTPLRRLEGRLAWSLRGLEMERGYAAVRSGIHTATEMGLLRAPTQETAASSEHSPHCLPPTLGP